MKEVDTDGGGSMDFGEFCELMAIKLQTVTPKEEVHRALTAFDTSKDLPKGIDAVPLTGYATVEEFERMLAGLGMDEKESNEILLWCRPNKEGLIDYGEFVN